MQKMESAIETGTQGWVTHLKTECSEQVNKIMTTDEEVGVEVQYPTLLVANPELAKELVANPEESLKKADTALESILKEELEDGERNGTDFHVHVSHLYGEDPPTGDDRHTIRNTVRQGNIGKLIYFEGMVSSVSEIKPEVKRLVYRCEKCGEIIMVTQGSSGKLRKPAVCDNSSCNGRGPFTEQYGDEGCKYGDWQVAVIQERPESMQRDTNPRTIACILRDDLCEAVTPGYKVIVTGYIIPMEAGNTRLRKVGNVLDFLVNTVHMEVVDQLEVVEITKEDEERIHEFARDPELYEKIESAIAPDILGMAPIKRAISYQLFGGNTKLHGRGASQRGWINILMLGDPSVGKSALLTWVSQFMPGAMYGSGTGSSKVGMTAAAVKDEITGDWMLYAGSFVLAHESIACLDEFEKMSEEDRKGLHVAMEQGLMVIDKAKIHATLVARSAVLAAANPKHGRLDPYQAIPDQIDLTPALMSRFDLVFPLIDTPKEDNDAMLAKHIIDRRGKEMERQQAEAAVDLEFLKKYVLYAREHVRPVIRDDEVKEKAVKFYTEERNKEAGAPMKITTRQFQAIIRMAEARARARLDDRVAVKDIEEAIELMRISMKHTAMDPLTGEVDVDTMETGKPKSQWERLEAAEDAVKAVIKSNGGMAEEEDILEALRDAGMTKSQAKKYLYEIKRDGDIYEPRPGKWGYNRPL